MSKNRFPIHFPRHNMYIYLRGLSSIFIHFIFKTKIKQVAALAIYIPKKLYASPTGGTSPRGVIMSPASQLPASSTTSRLFTEEGNVYSLATSGGLLYAGSEGKNVRVWRERDDDSVFRSSSGFVKAIVVTAHRRVFTAHRDGKIRVWRASTSDPTIHKRVATLPRLKHCVTSSFIPSNYVEVRRHRSVLWLRHFDAVSCLALSEDEKVLYSGSWDRTVKAWSVSDFSCLDSLDAHNDAVNSLATGYGGFLFSGSADGTVKVWRRETTRKATEHSYVDTLLKQDSAVTSLAVMNNSAAAAGCVLYCGSSDGGVNFWEVENNLSHGGVLRGHRLAVLCLATAGPLVVSGSSDKTICVWRKGSDGMHSRLSVLSGHLAPVKCLAVEFDCRDYEGKEGGRCVVYSGSLDGCVMIWKVG